MFRWLAISQSIGTDLATTVQVLCRVLCGPALYGTPAYVFRIGVGIAIGNPAAVEGIETDLGPSQNVHRPIIV